MSASEVAVKRYVVRLSRDERKRLDEMIHKGKSSAQKLMKARILLKADVSEGGEGWSDSRIVEALETSATTVYRTRQQLVEEGFEAVLSRTSAGPAHARYPDAAECQRGGSLASCPVPLLRYLLRAFRT